MLEVPGPGLYGLPLDSLVCNCHKCRPKKKPFRPYDGPPPHTCDSPVATLGVSCNLFFPGDKVTATVNLRDWYWSSMASLYCSFADTSSVVVDGVETTGYSSPPFEYCGHGAAGPGCTVNLTGLGVHTVEFTLLDDYEEEFWNGTGGGPMVVVFRGSLWSTFLGFVIE